MRKFNILMIAVFLFLLGVQETKAVELFKFPQIIQYKLLKNDHIVGECQLLYQEKTDKKGISSLKLKNLQGFGFTSQESIVTYMFTDSFSIYANFLLRGKEKIFEIRLTEGIGFDGKRGRILIYKGQKNPLMLITLYGDYPVIDLPTLFFIISKKVFR